ncbi:hypothetical protein ACFYYB_26130 [Streptomyces sp. NPDC002886]|uniref:hypothetical protein n=1 Tax=Streptomyces sp. NPDC002886 TaxID=3364667 RepID=UPI0036B29C22
MTRTSGARLLLVTAVTLLLLTCTVAAWALPRTHTNATSGPAAISAEAVHGPCGRILGPARDYCTRTTRWPVAVAEQAALRGGTFDARSGLLLFSAVTVAAAIGLVSTAGRRL